MESSPKLSTNGFLVAMTRKIYSKMRFCEKEKLQTTTEIDLFTRKKIVEVENS
jgi:hypothetical protein